MLVWISLGGGCLTMNQPGQMAIDQSSDREMIPESERNRQWASRRTKDWLGSTGTYNDYVSQLEPGAQIKVYRNDRATGKDSVTTGTILKADISGIALMNSTTVSVHEAADGFNPKLIKRKGVDVDQFPVQWVPLTEIVDVQITRPTNQSIRIPDLDINMQDERYLQKIDQEIDLIKYAAHSLSWNAEMDAPLEVDAGR